MKNISLAAFSVERRIAAINLFRNIHLEDTRLRHLQIDTSKASGSTRELVQRMLEHYRPDFLAISRPSIKAGQRMRVLCDVAKETATMLGIPTIDVEVATLMQAYGHPPLKRKEYVRRAGRTIWPSLNNVTSRRAAVDAATTGLYVQVERLFSLHGEPV